MTQKHQDRFREWHWGVEPAGTVVTDSRYPDWLVECGRLRELYFKRSGTARGRRWSGRRENLHRLPEAQARDSHLAFDSDVEGSPLYIVASSGLQADMAPRYRANRAQALRSIAQRAPGRHSSRAYPDVRVSPIGVLTRVTYGTHKKGDGPSWYIHKMGEETGKPPLLTVAEDGTLWIAGGDYYVTTEGIRN